MFLVDTEFSSIFYRDIAFKQLKAYYDKLSPEDHVGFILLGSQPNRDDIILERKDMNKHLKEKVLKKVAES